MKGRPHMVDSADFLYDVSQTDLDRELGSRSMRDFVEMAWPLVEPGTRFKSNWHIDAVCEHLEAAVHGDLKRLCISIPPGCMKSLTCSVLLVPWAWTHKPEMKFINGSYSDTNMARDSVKAQNIITSDWYTKCWGHVVQPKKDRWTIRQFANKEGGFRAYTTVKGGITGEHADFHVIDDPTRAQDANGSLAVAANALEATIAWYDGTMSSRATDSSKFVRLLIMQRLHEKDLTGHVLKNGGYEHLMLPMEFEPARKCFTSIGFEDPRTEEGELLWPEHFPAEVVETKKIDLGPRAAAAQLQQNPTPAEGNIFLAKWTEKRYEELPKFSKLIQSWDCTFKEGGTSFVVGQVWGTKDSDYYLLDEFRKKVGFSDTCLAIKAMSAKWPRAHLKLIEDKANGPAVVDVLKKKLTGLKLVQPEGGKIVRAEAVEHLWAAGNVVLPSDNIAPWIEEWVLEIIKFPNGAYDDRVDAMSQALLWLQLKSTERLRKAMNSL